MTKATSRAPSRLGRKHLWLLGSAATLIFSMVAETAVAQVAEIIVTARKREENVQNVPVTADVFNTQQLQTYDTTSIDKLTTLTPGLLISHGASGSGVGIALRGISGANSNIGIASSVSVNADDVYFGFGRAIDDGFFDMSSVQVLRGPQALFYGKNATAGAVALVSNDPTDKFTASMTTSYEFTAKEPEVQAVVSGPLTDTLGLRVAVMSNAMFGGYLRNVSPPGTTLYTTKDAANGLAPSTYVVEPLGTNWLDSRDQDLIRATLKWTPTPNLTAKLKLEGSYFFDNIPAGSTYQMFYCSLGHPQVNDGHSCGEHFATTTNPYPVAIYPAIGGVAGENNGRPFNKYELLTAIPSVEYQGNNFTITEIAGFDRTLNSVSFDSDGTALSRLSSEEHDVWSQESSETRLLTSFKFPVNFSGGFLFEHTNLDVTQSGIEGFSNTAASPANEFLWRSLVGHTAGTTYSLFGQAIWDILPNLELTGGGRYTDETKKSDEFQPYVNPALPYLQYPKAGPSALIIGDQKWTNFSPEVVLTWKPVSGLTIYGGYKTGYKSGGFSTAAIIVASSTPGQFEFQPEIASGYEGGIKATLFDHQLTLDLTAYDYLYKNLQVDFFNNVTFSYVTLNAASARSRGVELQFDYAPAGLEGFEIAGEFDYNHSRYGNFIAPCTPTGESVEQGCALLVVGPVNSGNFTNACGPAALPACNFSNVAGRPTEDAPEWTSRVNVAYHHSVGNLVGTFTFGVNYSSSYFINPFGSTAVPTQAAYAKYDASIRLATADGKWEVALIGQNLSNAFVVTNATSGVSSGSGTGRPAGFPGQIIADDNGSIQDPRTVKLVLSWKY